MAGRSASDVASSGLGVSTDARRSAGGETEGRLDLLIGANACAKSNVLDDFRFLHEGVAEKDFA